MGNVDWNEIRKRMKAYDYPENHSFDPDTLQSTGRSVSRVKALTEILTGVGLSGRLLDVGCNRGWFTFTFGCFLFASESWFSHIVGIDPIGECIGIAEDIRSAHDFPTVEFKHVRFEQYDGTEPFNTVHFGQCAHYLFRDCVRRGEHPLKFLDKAKDLALRHILIDGAFDGDPSVEYDAKADRWAPEIKKLATIEGYATALRPEFKLIKYARSGDASTRYMAVFERI